MRIILLIFFTAIFGSVHAIGGGPTIYIFFDNNNMPLKTYVNDTLIAMVAREDLVINVANPGRYVLEFKNEDIDDLRIIDIKGDEIVYYRFRRGIGKFKEITFEEAQNFMDPNRKKIVIEGEHMPGGLPLPE